MRIIPLASTLVLLGCVAPVWGNTLNADQLPPSQVDHEPRRTVIADPVLLKRDQESRQQIGAAVNAGYAFPERGGGMISPEWTKEARRRGASDSKRGYALLAERRYSAAAPVFRNAIKLNPFTSYTGLGDALLGLKRYEEALEVLRRVQSPDSRLKYAIALYYTGHKGEAAEIYNRAVAQILVGQGQEIRATFPTSLEPRSMTGRQLETAARTAGALWHLSTNSAYPQYAFIEAQEAVRLDPDSVLARYCLGQALVKTQPEKAMKLINAAAASAEEPLKAEINRRLPELQQAAEKSIRERAQTTVEEAAPSR